MENSEGKYHRIETVEIGEEVLSVGYYWDVDTEPFVGGHLTEKSEVISRRPALRVVEGEAS